VPARKPQINFQVETPMKVLYDEAKAAGHWVTRLCAAGFLLMIEDAQLRQRAIARLRDWEDEFDRASAASIRAFVEEAQAAMQSGARGSSPARRAPAARKKAKR
jgi:hypothetical protein